jgi:hypothetical protein
VPPDRQILSQAGGQNAAYFSVSLRRNVKLMRAATILSWILLKALKTILNEKRQSIYAST